MRLFNSILISSVLIFASGHAAKADVLNPGAKKAVVELQQTIDDLSTLSHQERMQRVLSQMISKGTQALAEEGYRQQAIEIEREWRSINASFLRGTEDIGDHQPLSQWLADVYDRMEKILGPARMQQLQLDDIFIINYAVPVVINPRGKWNKREYARHFVPLAGVIAYWTSYGSCMQAFAGRRAASKFCDKVAVILERGMTNDIAPTLSNFVYDKFNKRGFRGEFMIGYDELSRRYGPEIARIQN